MYPEIATLALCATATGFSYYFYKQAKRVSDLATRASDLARLMCKDSSMYCLATKTALRKVVALETTAADHVTVSAGHATQSKVYATSAAADATIAAGHSVNSESFKLMAKEHAEEAK